MTKVIAEVFLMFQVVLISSSSTIQFLILLLISGVDIILLNSHTVRWTSILLFAEEV